MNFHAKSLISSSKNGIVVAIGTKEDIEEGEGVRGGAKCLQLIIQSNSFLAKLSNNNGILYRDVLIRTVG